MNAALLRCVTGHSDTRSKDSSSAIPPADATTEIIAGYAHGRLRVSRTTRRMRGRISGGSASDVRIAMRLLRSMLTSQFKSAPRWRMECRHQQCRRGSVPETKSGWRLPGGQTEERSRAFPAKLFGNVDRIDARALPPRAFIASRQTANSCVRPSASLIH